MQRSSARRTFAALRQRGDAAARALCPHRIGMFRGGESSRANLFGIVSDRALDGGPELAEALDEFRRPRRQAEHIFKDEHLTVAGGAGADADRRNRNLRGNAAAERLSN